ncbi:MAG: molecular chaperone HscC [Clostridiales bacterium]|jgi:molecular chaperone HscC|nr:molecular chaperone HscC [Clostridiales bacterium]
MIIGIDLGTTNSLVAYFTESGPQIIPNSFGENLTPSVVSVGEEGEVYIGKIAKERLITNPDMSVSVFKRGMGSKKEYVMGEKIYLPEELSALIIKKLKEDAEDYLKTGVEEAIISVPAYFNDIQRRATKMAGEIAGLKVERIVNEPTAAAIAYGLHEKKDYTKYLIFDLGGGTFDVSILELYKNVMEVRAVAGDNFLGGEDFNNVLEIMFMREHDIKESSLSKKDMAALSKAAELAKRGFTSKQEVTMSCKIGGQVYEMGVDIKTYERNCELLFGRLKKPIVRALSDASIKLADIDTIVLVGGATKFSLVKNFVAKLFGRLPASSINPDEVVALGVALQCAMKERDAMIKEIVLTDVCPFTLGTSVSNMVSDGIYQHGNFFPIIERNTIIPVSRVERFSTINDNQKVIRIDILQGESRKSKDNIFLGELVLDVMPAPAGRQSVDIRYTYDINGILEVEATIVSTKEVKKVIIEKNPGILSEAEINRRLEEISSIKIHPREKDEYAFVLAKGERIYEESVGETRKMVANYLSRYEEALDKQDELAIRKMAKELLDLFEYIEENEIE